ncbi:MAG: peptidase prolyl oligopeptidase active site domain protein [Firmicutes bacterium]|nr:peptidase prolyl oligopeptidase active site domain protein [Bacillota bacterium]
MEKRLMTPADIYNLTYVGDAQISPDGKLVAYVREKRDQAVDKQQTEIWLAPAAGGVERQLTAGPTDSLPRWSPDGRTLAFVSDRSGKPQLHLITVNGGEAARLETEQEVAGAPVWSPDGKRIAYLSSVDEPLQAGDLVYAGAPTAKVAPKGEQKAEKPAIKVVSTFHHKFDGGGFFGRKEPRLFVVPAEAGKQEAKQVSPVGIRCDGPSWSPCGKFLVAAVAPPADDAGRAFYVRNIALFHLDSGAVTYVLKERESPTYSPTFSPDGKYLAFSGHTGPFTWLHDNMDVWVLDISTEAYPYAFADARNLSATLDRSLGGVYSETSHMGGLAMFGPLLWSNDSRDVLAVFADRGDAVLYACHLNGDNPTRLTGTGPLAVGSFSVAVNGDIAMGAATPATPDEIYLLDKGHLRQLTGANAALLAKVALQKVEKFTYAGADGWEMEAWLVYPAGYEPGKRYPTVLDIHGGPTGLWGNGFSTSWQVLAAAGYAVVATNPRGSQGYGKKHTFGCVNDWGGKDFIDIQNGVDEAVKRGVADPDRLGVTGWSYGGFMTCWTVTQTHRFKAAVAGACVSNLDDMANTSDIGSHFLEFEFGLPWEKLEKLAAHSPIRHMHHCTTPVLLLHGESDLRCPPHQSEQVYTVLKRNGQTAALVRYPDEPHVFQRPSHQVDRLERMVAWFGHYLS